MIDCPQCTRPIAEGQAKCLNCGHVVNWAAVLREAWPLVMLTGSGAALLVLLMYLLMR